MIMLQFLCLVLALFVVGVSLAAARVAQRGAQRPRAPFGDDPR